MRGIFLSLVKGGYEFLFFPLSYIHLIRFEERLFTLDVVSVCVLSETEVNRSKMFRVNNEIMFFLFEGIYLGEWEITGGVDSRVVYRGKS